MGLGNTRSLLKLVAVAGTIIATLSAADGVTAAPPSASLVFASSRSACGGFDIYSVSAAGTGLERISDTCLASDPSWSPDGSRIAFTSTRDNGTNAVYTMRADGTDVHRISPVGVVADQPSWGGDLVAFRGGGADVGLWVVRADGTGARKLTDAGFSPALAPDGTRLAYLDPRIVDAQTSSHSIRIVPTDGSAAPFIVGRGDGGPAWSPDARKLAWLQTAGHAGTATIVVGNADGTDIHPVYERSGLACSDASIQPDWSPDGASLAFAACFDGSANEIFTPFVAAYL